MTTPSDSSASVARLAGALERQAEELRSVRTHLGITAREDVRLLRPDDVATRLSKSRAWVYRNQHALGGFRVGGQVRFEPGSVDAYLDRCRQQGGTRERRSGTDAPLLPVRATGRVSRGETRPAVS